MEYWSLVSIWCLFFICCYLFPQEEELRKSGEAKYAHLSNDLHVLIEVFAPPGEAYARMSHALEEIKKFLVPVSLRFDIIFSFLSSVGFRRTFTVSSILERIQGLFT